MDLQTIGVVLGVAFGAAAASYPKVKEVLNVVIGPKDEPNLRELLENRLNDHEETLVEHEMRIEKLEAQTARLRDRLR